MNATKKSVFLGTAALIIALFGGAMAAAPAMAVGSFNYKVTPGGCTETDFKGKTSKAGSVASGYTTNGAVTCPFTHLQDRITMKMNGVTGATQTSTNGAVSTTLSGVGIPTGKHALCVFVNTFVWNCDFNKNT